MADDDVDVTDLSTRPNGRVKMRVQGPFEAVSTWVDRYLDEYPSMGYGTSASAAKNLSDGRVEVIVERARAC